MKRFLAGYIRHARLVGALYSIVPTLAGFMILFALSPFREVYLLRLTLALVLGGLLSGYLHAWAIGLFLAKHRSPEGPATVLDGTLLGAGIGLGSALIPPVTAFIQSNHIEHAKGLVIAQWSVGLLFGAIVGTLLAIAMIRDLARN